MPLSWNEIRSRGVAFAHEFQDATRENSETQTFYNEFFNVFGISRRRVASFEEPVKKIGDKHGRIDLFWKGTLLVEQKSAGRDLVAAKSQALDYFPNLTEDQLPQYVLVSDFQNFELYDLDAGTEVKFKLKDLPNNVEHFGFIAGYKRREYKDQDPVNIRASEIMGGIHDALKANGYVGAELELFLVRLLFCLFADDTGIFEKDILTAFIEERTREDGSDLGGQLAMLFQTLNQDTKQRPKNLDEDLARFAYINGDLFRSHLPLATFDSTMRDALLKACYFDWSDISPAVFGALFQSVMDKEKRRGIGAHYTGENNIMKIIGPLFMDELHAEFEAAGNSKAKLTRLHDKLATMRVLDPACGCGNFLIIAYRELRLLEIEILNKLLPDKTQLQMTDLTGLSHVNVDQFYGIEIEEFPARIAEVAMWLIDHQMNIRLSEAFGYAYVRIPLTTSPHIVNANALKADWSGVVPAKDVTVILGNPPFIGHAQRSDDQKADQYGVWGNIGKFGRLDFVSSWYRKALDYMEHNPDIRAAFVSTNSICQGEQASILWTYMFDHGAHIHFAHRTFQWASDARGKAAVQCVIVGFGLNEVKRLRLFDYENVKADPLEAEKVSNINAYLVDADNISLPSRTKCRPGYPKMTKGSQATDGQNLFLTENEKDVLLAKHPELTSIVKPFIGADEMLHDTPRYCLWFHEHNTAPFAKIPEIARRLDAVRQARLQSDTESVQKLAAIPSLFTQIRQPTANYVAIPRHSSETRKYIPMAYYTPDTIVGDAVTILADPCLYYFGILQSEMHMVWVRYVCGRLESRFRYSPAIYDNFPFPRATDVQTKAIEKAARHMLEVRATFENDSLADLYDPLGMPPTLTKAHQALDKAVDKAYRPQPFPNDRLRMEYLFARYKDDVAPLMSKTKQG